MSLGKQLVIGGILLLIVGAAGFAYHRMAVEGEAAAAVGRGPSAVPVEVATAAAGTMRERIEAVGTTLARQAVDIVALSAGGSPRSTCGPASRSRRARSWSGSTTGWSRPRSPRPRRRVREAQLALERAQKLRANNTVAQATVDELQATFDGAQARLDAAEKQLADRTVRAPFAGVVGMRRVDVGARVDNDTVLTTLDDVAELEVEFSVPEIYFGRVRPGLLIGAASAAFPGRTFEGRIATIDTRVGQVSRAFRVRAVIPNPDLVAAGRHVHARDRGARGAAGGADPGAGGAGRRRQHLRVQAARGAGGAAAGAARAARGRCGRGAGRARGRRRRRRERPPAAARRGRGRGRGAPRRLPAGGTASDR